MADDDVKIKIGTEADTTGAETAEEAMKRLSQAVITNPMTDGSQLRATKQATEATKEHLEAIDDLVAAVRQLTEEEEAALKAQQDADVERAKNLKATREGTDEASDGFDRLFNQQRLQGIGQQLEGLARVSGEFVRKFSETEQGKEAIGQLSEELTVLGSTAASVASGAAAGFATGGPWGAAIGGLTGLVKTLGDEWINTNERIMASNREFDQALAESTARIEARKKAAIDRAVEERFAAERLELQKQREELEHIKALRDAQQGLSNAQDKLGDQRAAQAGVPQSSIDNGNIGRELQDEIQGLGDQITESRAKLNLLSQSFELDQQAYEKKAREIGSEAAATSAEFQKMQQSLAGLASADRYLKALEERAPIEAERFRTEATAAIEREFGGVKDKVGQDVTDNAKKAIQEIEAISKEKGGQLTKDARDVLERLYATVKDGIPNEDQANDLKLLMSTFRTTVEGQQKDQYATFSALMDGFRDSATQLQQHKAEIDQIRSWMKTQQSQR